MIRAILIFAIAFSVVFGLLNFGSIYNQIVKPNVNEKANNIALENFYREKYGQAAQMTPKPSQTNIYANLIRVPKINISAPIITSTSTEDKKILSLLEKGVVIYPGSLPGQNGTTIILGHSSSTFPSNKYSSIFAGLNNLVVGDIITVNYNGQIYTYIVKDKKVGSPSVLMSMHFKNDLILSTCWPIGTDKDRIIVMADLM